MAGRALVLVLALGLGAGCSDGNSGAPEVVVAVSPDPDSVPDGVASLTGRVTDYITGTALRDAVVSTFPPTTLLRTDREGRYIFSEGIAGGRIYELQGEANGFARGSVVARATPGRTLAVDLTLVPDERALPLALEPGVLVFTGDRQRVSLSAVSEADGPLELSVEGPPWVELVGATPIMQPGERRALTFRLAPAAFAEATAALPEGASLEGLLELRDPFGRVKLLAAVAVPASPAAISLEVDAPPRTLVRRGEVVALLARARFAAVPLVGAELSVEGVGPITPDAALPVTDDAGRAILTATAGALGEARIRVALPAYPKVPPVEVRLQVIADAPCVADAAGRNACGEARFWRCEERLDGGVDCADLDECAPGPQGQTACGEASRWTCHNVEGGPPTCEDVAECATDNGGCGAAARVICREQIGAAPECEDVAECAVDNGGCGDRRYVRCVEVFAGPPECHDVDACAVGADGRTGCGDPRYTRCEDDPGGGPPACADVEECAVDNGGCGDPRVWRCEELDGEGRRCVDVDECAPDAAGFNGCGRADAWICRNLPGQAPDCVDVPECAVDNGGCGDARLVRCEEVRGGPPRCADVPECATNNGGCGDPARIDCVEGTPHACEDRDECVPDANGFTECGPVDRVTCVNRHGLPPVCLDVDECAADAEGRNGCGLAAFWRCLNQDRAPPVCEDLDECAEDNGGCGAAAAFRCVDEVGAPPTCLPVDPCAPDAEGRNTCGLAAHWHCEGRGAAEPLCVDLDECAPGIDGRNQCGVAALWRCVDQMGAPPTCEDRDECADGGPCGDPAHSRCVNQLGAPPICVDVIECAIDNGGCGDPRWVHCQERVAAPSICTPLDGCAVDAEGRNGCGLADQWECVDTDGPPDCVDRDGCAVVDGRTDCGDALTSTCRDLEGEAPLCEACPAGAQNLDLDPENGCEYACQPRGVESCDGRDDDCDGRVDEGFDLDGDPENCGVCGRACAPGAQVERVTCAVGRCVIAACAEGWRDDDGDASTGCEGADQDGTIWVDQRLGSADAPGTAEEPVDTLARGLALVGVGGRVRVRPGVYRESISLNRRGVSLEGAGPEAVTIVSFTEAGPAITIGADDVTVARLGVTGGYTGIGARGQPFRLLRNIRVQDVHVARVLPADRVSDSFDGIEARGLSFEWVEGLRISGVVVRAVHGSAPTMRQRAQARHGGTGVGIELHGVHGCVLEGVEIGDVGGARGQDHDCCGAGRGGDAVGVRLTETTDCRLRGLRISAARAGAGGDLAEGQPGQSAGVHVRTSTGIEIEDLQARALAGGDAGEPAPMMGAAGGSAAAVFVEESATVALSDIEARGLVGGDAAGGHPAGAAQGIGARGADALDVERSLGWDLRDGEGEPNAATACVALEDSTGAAVRGLSCARTRNGIHVAAGAPEPVRVRDALGAELSGALVQSDPANAAFMIDAAWLGCHACAAWVPNGLVGPGRLDAPLGFVDLAQGDLRLRPTSPAIDAGDPGAPVGLEPAPNGCRINLGRYGGSPLATAAAGDEVEHCGD